MNKKFQQLEEILIKFNDKHQLLRRGIYLGLIVNGILYYEQFVKFAALKRMQEYLGEKSAQFDERLQNESEQIIQSLQNDNQKKA